MITVKLKSNTLLVTPLEFFDLPFDRTKRVIICPDPDCFISFVKSEKRICARFEYFSNSVMYLSIQIPFFKSLRTFGVPYKFNGVSIKSLLGSPRQSYSKGYFVIDDYFLLFSVDEVKSFDIFKFLIYIFRGF